MRLNKKYDIHQLRDYSSVFTRSEVMRWRESDWSSLRAKVERYDPNLLKSQCTYLTYIKYVYRVLEKFYPNEYVYKNEFITKWLLEEIGIKDSILFSEFRLGKVVADLAMFNGISRVFEIKTLLDKETRLSNQVQQYRRLFNEVYLIVPEAKSTIYLKLDSDVGVIAYNQTNGSFELLRSAQFNIDISVDILMEVLHTKEYITLAKLYYGDLPPYNDFNKFKICKELIQQIPQEFLNNNFVLLMKARNVHNAFSKKENQFNQLCLSMNYDLDQRRKLLSKLSTTIC
jgi:hypothetical protein